MTPIQLQIFKELYEQNQALLHSLNSVKPWYESFLPVIYTLLGAGVAFLSQYYFHKENNKSKRTEDISKLYSQFGIALYTFNESLFHQCHLNYETKISDFKIHYYNQKLKHEDTIYYSKLSTEKSFNQRARTEENKGYTAFNEVRNECLKPLLEISFRLKDKTLDELLGNFNTLLPVLIIPYSELDKSRLEDDVYVTNFGKNEILTAIIKSTHLTTQIKNRITKLS